nr:hypothetical protein [uncultured Alistipes sp.]
MKPIKERAKAYARKIWANGKRDYAPLKKMAEQDFSAGAQSEREELLCWHDPKTVTPYTDEEVLVMVHRQFNTYDVMRHDHHGWWQKAPGGGWCAADCEILGWRPILENE